MKKLSLIISLFFFSLPTGITQLFEDFSDGELLNNPQWSGDLDHFIINDESQLQLNAPEAGTSFIYVPTNIGSPQSWEIFVKMEFNPSTSNLTRIYLNLNSTDLDKASGYFIQLGASGSEDAVELYALENGSNRLLASGTAGSVATDPATARLKISFEENEIWRILADFDGGNDLVFDLSSPEPFDPTIPSFFGIYCKYTATRVDKFFFDDINIPDISAPSVSNPQLLDPETILLCLSEDIMDLDLDQLSLNPELPISSVELTDEQPPKLLIKLQEPLSSGVTYRLNIKDIQDLNGNVRENTSVDLVFVRTASSGDILVNEILFDPYSQGEDFVEIYNPTDQIISLENIFLANLDKNEFELIINPSIINPGEYLVFTSDATSLSELYQVQQPDQVYEQNIPSYNNADGNVSIVLLPDQIAIDSFDYTHDLHFELLDDTEGVSLERLSFSQATNENGNWHSASSAAGFATPGYENSNFVQLNPSSEMFSLNNHIFSPNGDGDDDQLIVNYALNKPGYVLNLAIFDSRGYMVKKLEQSLLPSTNGFVQWNGITDEGIRSSIGVYILYISGFHPDGDVFDQKLTFILADFLE